MSNETASFMVRFTQKIYEDESGASNVQWRGRISHVQGGHQQSFTDIQDALTFIQDHLADLTVSNTQGHTPEEQDNLLKKSFDMWRRLAKEAPGMVIDTIKDPVGQVAKVQQQISSVKEEVEQRLADPIATMKDINNWRTATKSDFQMVMDQLSTLTNQVSELSKTVDALSKK